MRKSLYSWFASAAFAFAAFVAGTSPAQAQLSAGSDYIVISPALPSEGDGKIEVIEFFSYGCPHCADLAASANKWAAKLPADVAFKRVPVSFNPYYQLMAKLYYTLEALGELPRLDAAVFDAIHVKGLRLIDDKSLIDWASAQGIDAKKFSDTLKSFGVQSKTNQANTLTRAAKVPGVPAFVVDGHYLVNSERGAQHGGVLALTDKVIAKVRAEKAK